MRLRLRCKTSGVTRRWILGAFVRGFFPSFPKISNLYFCLIFYGRLPSLTGKVRRITYLRTSSSFPRLNKRRILLARLGPRRRGTEESVRPGISASPKILILVYSILDSFLIYLP